MKHRTRSIRITLTPNGTRLIEDAKSGEPITVLPRIKMAKPPKIHGVRPVPAMIPLGAVPLKPNRKPVLARIWNWLTHSLK